MRFAAFASCLSLFTATSACSDGAKQSVSATSGAGASGSASSSGSGGAGGNAGSELLAGLDCDPMVPTQCGFPFPSNVWLVDDASTKTGKRVRFGKTTLPVLKTSNAPIDPSPWADSDGFSTGQAPMTHMPGATITGLPTQDTIDASLDKNSPTVLIEADTGKPLPHFAEIDANADTKSGDEGALMIRPVVRLKDATRYIVAIRKIVDKDGKPLPANPVFVALRDGGNNSDPTVIPRRALYQDILAKLKNAGYETSDLQIAWDYTTASRENNTRWLLHMRDDALATVGKLGPEYTIDKVEENPNANIRRRISGKMKVPLYLDKPEPGGKLLFGANGLPKQNGTAQFEFVVHVPHSALKKPAGLLQNGHGLLGKLTQGQDGYLAKIANTGNFVAFSVNLVGMASDDEPEITKAIAQDFGLFRYVVDRQHQGVLNSLLAMRMISGRFVDDANVQFDGKSVIDPTQRYYRGDSQGGIFGCTYMALTTDVTNGYLGVPGMPYNLLLNRSIDFEPFFAVLRVMYKNMRNVQLVLALAQMLWDRTEPNGYCPYLTQDRFPNTPDHRVLFHVAIGDYQVSPLGAHVMARTVGAKTISPQTRPIWGITSAEAPYAGSAIVEFDFGLPPAPKTNVPPTGTGFPKDGDPHGKVRDLESAILQGVYFLHQGKVIHTCKDACDPE
jgi:hypothetical protein